MPEKSCHRTAQDLDYRVSLVQWFVQYGSREVKERKRMIWCIFFFFYCTFVTELYICVIKLFFFSDAIAYGLPRSSGIYSQL